MRMYTIARKKRKTKKKKRKRFHRLIESQMFLFISDRHIGVHPMYTNMASS